MRKDNIYFENGECLCAYKGNWQIIYFDDCRVEHELADNVFTREMIYYHDNWPYYFKKILSYDPPAGMAEGMCYFRGRNGDIKPERKFTVDYKKSIETVAADEHGQGISEISFLDPINFSTIKRMQYHPSGNLAAIENYQTNLLHGVVLRFYDSERCVPENTVSDIKRYLKEYDRYENGMLLASQILNEEGILCYKTIGSKYGSDDVRHAAYDYQKDRQVITYSNRLHTYQRDTIINGSIVARYNYNKDGYNIYYENRIYKEETGKDLKVYTTQFFPSAWDENGRVTCGSTKRFDGNILISNGPFKTLGNNFVNEGIHILKKGEVNIYQDGEIIKKYKEKVFEQNGGLIIAAKDLSQTNRLPLSDYKQ